MAGITRTLTNAAISRMTSPHDGVNVRIAAIEQAAGTPAAVGIRSIAALNASIETTEKTGNAHYPALLVYVDRIANALREKFRQFSGKAHLVVEVRHSQEQLDGLEKNTQVYVDAVCALLDDSRGDWGNGAFYAGGYEISYEAVARGGRNFLQRAMVGFDVEVSK